MSYIWGQGNCSMNDGVTEVVMEESIVDPGFFHEAEIMHQSCLSGKRTWSRSEDYVEFEVMFFLCNYTAALAKAKATDILKLKNKIVTFAFSETGGLVQQVYLAEVHFFPLVQPYEDDVAILSFKNTDYLQISRRIKEIPGRKWIKADTGKILRTRGIII